MVMSRQRPLALAAAGLAMAILAGCGDGKMSEADGKETAKKSRQPVAKEYWRLHYALGEHVYLTFGTGGFTTCDGNKPNDSLTYIISEAFEGKSGKQTDEQFVSMVKGRLSSAGWSLKPAGEKVQAAKKDGVEVQLRLLNRPKGDGALARLIVRGKCTDVGHAKGEVIKNYSGSKRDEYKASSSSPSPIPSFIEDLS
jgi:hypothetical protein